MRSMPPIIVPKEAPPACWTNPDTQEFCPKLDALAKSEWKADWARWWEQNLSDGSVLMVASAPLLLALAFVVIGATVSWIEKGFRMGDQ